MSAAQSYGHTDFMREYDCIFEQDFAFNGQTASWAPPHTDPRFWDEEDESIDLPTTIPTSGIVPSSALALTPDGKFLAVALNTVIRLYDMETLELRAEVEGYASNLETISFCPRVSSPAAGDAEAKYALLSQNVEWRDTEPKIFQTLFSASGHRIYSTTSFPLPLATGALPRFHSQIWDHDGSRLLYIAHPTHLSHAPEVVILSLPSGSEAIRLRGHKDTIPWAGWSPDNTLVATASWDRTFGIWVAVSGVRRHSIRTNGQNWCGAWFTDGRHVLLSGGGGPNWFGVYDVESAELIVAVQPPGDVGSDRWLRDFAVHPSRELVVLGNGRSLLAWTPSESEDHPSVQVLLALQQDSDVMKNDFGGLKNLEWVDRGRKLIAQSEDQTIFIWEPEKQWKWRFQRPRGRAAEDENGPDVLHVRRKRAEWVLSAGENRVRLWKL